MSRWKLAVVTSTRAEYGLLYPLIRALEADDDFQVQVIVTGTHLLASYGNTVRYIEEDGVSIAYRIPIMQDGDSSAQIIARAVSAFDAVYEKERYDGVVVLGDRYELYGFCLPALMRRIPLIHLHGGEKTEGAIDERIRHSITKMASLHFPSLPQYAKRIVQMGEQPAFVHPVGAIGLDNILALTPIPPAELEEELQLSFDSPTALVTFHPVTLDTEEQVRLQAERVFRALWRSGLTCLVTMPNSDTGGDMAREVIARYVEQDPTHFIYRKSLGQRKYLSVLRCVGAVIGNSSSGILEVPSFGIPTVDIGDRQQGRFAPDTVLHCACDEDAICQTIQYAFSPDFRARIKGYVSPYGDGKTAARIVRILKETDLRDERLRKKQFYDIDFKGPYDHEDD